MAILNFVLTHFRILLTLFITFPFLELVRRPGGKL